MAPHILGQTQPAPVNPLKQLSESLEALAENVSPTVVQIFTTGFAAVAGQDLMQTGEVTARRTTGSGVLVHPEGYIVTNAHVVAGAQRVRVLLTLATEGNKVEGSILRPRGRLLDAEVLGTDHETDLAILKINVKVLRYLKFADSDDLNKGSLVFAFGNPRRMEDGVAMGVVSSAARQLSEEDPMIYIQTDATINPGNSGGPLVNINGELVGINNFQATELTNEEGFGLAAPSNIVRTVYQQIRENGRVQRGVIGITAQTITPLMAKCLELPRDWRVIVSDVVPSSPADLAGIRNRDIILELDNKVMENARQLNVNIYQRGVGDTVNLTLLRDGATQAARVAVMERPDVPSRLSGLLDRTRSLIPQLGILVVDIPEEIGAFLLFLRSSSGIMVAARAPGSLSGSEFQPGDVIHSVNRAGIETVEGLHADLEKRKGGEIVVLLVERRAQFQYVTVELQ